MGKDSNKNSTKDNIIKYAKENRMIVSILAVIVFAIFIVIGLLIWVNCIGWSDWDNHVVAVISLVAGGIGGIGTLIAVVCSNIETRKVQKRNDEWNRKQLKLEKLNKKIDEYRILYELIEDYYNNIGTLNNFFIEFEKKIKEINVVKYIEEAITPLTQLTMNINKKGIIIQSRLYALGEVEEISKSLKNIGDMSGDMAKLMEIVLKKREIKIDEITKIKESINISYKEINECRSGAFIKLIDLNKERSEL